MEEWKMSLCWVKSCQAWEQTIPSQVNILQYQGFFAPPKISKKKSLFPRKCEEILKTYPPRQEKTNDKFEKLPWMKIIAPTKK